jgi:hypothetical protein
VRQVRSTRIDIQNLRKVGREPEKNSGVVPENPGGPIWPATRKERLEPGID